jgi:NAD(P)-dependent dehydrogenase (short-subunit alcohol dehydrogenase family)
MDVRLNGRVVLVTGAAQGVGQAVALEAARGGAAGVFVTDRNAGKARTTLDALHQIGVESAFVEADLIEASAPAKIFSAALAHFGRIDSLVNAAGMTNRASLQDATIELWDTLFAVNARAAFFLMQRFVAHRKDRKSPGAVVNILSINVHGGTPELAVYAATKAALAVTTKNAAHAHRFDRIRINGINLGWTDTPAERHMQSVTLNQGNDWLDETASRMPFGRLLSPDDVARLTMFLLSDASAPMTGALIDQEQSVVGPRDS